MKTIASIKGHALHQMLIPFPLAFLIGAFLADLSGAVLNIPQLYITGAYLSLAGVVMALIAAVPGAIDLIMSVPPQSSAKTRGTKHALFMVSSVILFSAAWLFRKEAYLSPGSIQLFIEAVGAGIITSGAWMGGTLVNRNFIATDHRYAYSGKWKETSIKAEPGKPFDAAEANELKKDQMKLLRVNGQRIVLARTETGYRAFSDRCSHRGGSLADGVLICGTVQCLWHGSQFDVNTGDVKAGPAKEVINTYKVIEKNGKVQIII